MIGVSAWGPQVGRRRDPGRVRDSGGTAEKKRENAEPVHITTGYNGRSQSYRKRSKSLLRS